MRSPHRKHERSSFFKYMTASTACAVLKNRTLRWSSPVCFNDPFDVPRELIIDIDYGDIVRSSKQYFFHLLQSPPEDTSQLSPKVRLIVDTVKAGVSPETKQQLLEILTNPEPYGGGSKDAQDALRQMWRSLIPDLRILCLTESPTHAAMWCHYAGDYSGVVLELSCIDEMDSALLLAERVTYPVNKPSIYTAEGWGELSVLDQRIAIERLLHIATRTKAPDWSYENEWRVVTFKHPNEIGTYSDYPFHPDGLAAIYIGPLTSESDQDALLSLMGDFPTAQGFKLSLGASREFIIHELDV